MHRLRVGIKFEDTIYKGNRRDYTLDGDISPEALDFFIRHHDKSNLQIMILSERSFTFKGRSHIRKWIRSKLEEWLLCGVKGRLEVAGIFIKPDIDNYMWSDKIILEGLINTWLDNVMDKIEIPIFNVKPLDVMIDSVDLFKSVLWDTPYLNQ